MDNIGGFILLELNTQGRTQIWLYKQYCMSVMDNEDKLIGYKAFNRKLKEDKLTAKDLILIAKILGINLNKLK